MSNNLQSGLQQPKVFFREVHLCLSLARILKVPNRYATGLSVKRSDLRHQPIAQIVIITIAITQQNN